MASDGNSASASKVLPLLIASLNLLMLKKSLNLFFKKTFLLLKAFLGLKW